MTLKDVADRFPTEAELLQNCNKNALSKALFLMHKAALAVSAKGLSGTKEQLQLLQVFMIITLSYPIQFMVDILYHSYYCCHAQSSSIDSIYVLAANLKEN